MNKLLTTNTGGFPIVLDDLRWFLGQSSSDAGIYQALNSLLRSFGDDFIVYGCENPGGDTINAGWIMLDGELLKVDAHSKSDVYYEKVTTYDSVGYKTFQNATDVDTYEKNRGVVSAAASNLAYNGDTLADKIKSLVASWQDAGDTSTHDALLSTFSSWTDLDLSSIVPTNYKIVWCRVRAQATANISADTAIMFRKNGNVNTINIFSYNILGAYGILSGNWVDFDFMCFMDTSRVIEYYLPTIYFTGGVYLYVKGWM